MTLRITGLNSGLDTESIITELASARSVKVQSLQKAQTKLSWKIDAWKSLNTEIYDLYSSTLSSMRFSSAYSSMDTTVSDSSVVSVVTGDDAVVGVQELNVEQLAKAGYLTGGVISTTDDSDVTTDTTLADLGITADTITFTIQAGASGGTGDSTTITLSSSSTIDDVISALEDNGVVDLNVNFDETNQRLFVSSASTGEANNFTLSADSSDSDSTDALTALGLNTDSSVTNAATKIEGQDAVITLNGAEFTSDDNNFYVNGLTYTVQAETSSPVTITTAKDTSGIYDMIKDFISTYNSLIIEMDTLYNADDASDYSPLTSDEKSDMSDDEIEAWEEKIKDSLLRRDSTLNSVASALKSVMSASYTLSDGTVQSLSTYGISTLSYFDSADNEKYAYHIDGDEDDDDTADESDLLQTAIINDPDTTAEFFKAITSALYSTLSTKMSSTDYSSAFTVYNDKEMSDEIDDYDDEIEDAQDKLNAYIDRWYSKFTAMETALATLNATSSSLSSLLG